MKYKHLIMNKNMNNTTLLLPLGAYFKHYASINLTHRGRIQDGDDAQSSE
jgi:hypothetical protein